MHLLSLALSTTLLFIPLVALYNITLCPLQRFPGPFLARCTGVWGFYLNLCGRRAHEIQRAHECYGSKIVNVLSVPDCATGGFLGKSLSDTF